jgi:toxin-antitoxin system PIN domain toxin
VILIDANLLVYAHVSSLPQHEAARAWLDARLNGAAPVGLPWLSLLSFLRLVSNPRVFEQPEPIQDAWRQVIEWLECSPSWVPMPTERHQEVLGPLLAHIGGRPNLVPDAHLAALAIEHGLALCSTDADFARFPGVRWENPIAGRSR